MLIEVSTDVMANLKQRIEWLEIDEKVRLAKRLTISLESDFKTLIIKSPDTNEEFTVPLTKKLGQQLIIMFPGLRYMYINYKAFNE
jgi:hypothetical protein